MSAEQEAFVEAFVRWHTHNEKGAFAEHLTEDFTFDDGMEECPRDLYLSLQRGSGPIDELAIIDIVVTQHRAAVMFEGVDSVTALFHRFCWMIHFKGPCIHRLSTCLQHLPKPEGRHV